MALAINHDGGGQRVYVLLGDGEMAEGSVWEAMNLAPHLGVDNLCAILDMNRLGQSDPTLFQWDSAGYAARAAAFGWDVHECDGHDVAALQAAFAAARDAGRPSFIVARTVKGKGVSFLEDDEAMHGKAVPDDQHAAALAEVEARIAAAGTPEVAANGAGPPAAGAAPAADVLSVATSYARGEKIATRKAYGAALAKLGAADPAMFVLDADVKKLSPSPTAFFDAFPERSVECFIAEQNMIGIATGLQARGKRAFAATFAAFLSRAFDQVRMAAHSQANLKLAGSHTGVSIGEDGASQMGLEDVAMLRAVLGSAVLCPADGVAAEKLTCLSANYDGVSYVRTARPDVAVIYGNDEEFTLGGSKVLRRSGSDRVTLVGAGVTLHEALAAADLLATEGIAARVIDCYSIKPLDAATLRAAAAETAAIVTAEDHYAEGGPGRGGGRRRERRGGTGPGAGGEAYAPLRQGRRAAGRAGAGCPRHRRRRPERARIDRAPIPSPAGDAFGPAPPTVRPQKLSLAALLLASTVAEHGAAGDVASLGVVWPGPYLAHESARHQLDQTSPCRARGEAHRLGDRPGAVLATTLKQGEDQLVRAVEDVSGCGAGEVDACGRRAAVTLRDSGVGRQRSACSRVDGDA